MTFPVTKLGEVCSFTRGLTYSKSDEVEFSSNVVVRATNIDLSTNKLDLSELRYISDSIQVKDDKRLKKDDILICTASGSKSHLGKVALVESDLEMSFGGFMGALRVNPQKITAKYLFTFLVCSEFKRHIESLSDGANINNLKFSQIEQLELPLPPLAIQQKIVAKLDAIFSEIDKATAAAEANAKNAETLFKSYLNQFFESRSEGWTEKPLPSLCTLFNGRAYSKNELLNSGKYTVLRVGNFFTNEHWYYSDLELEDNKYCDNGDLLYAWSASFGPRIWGGDKVIYHYHIWKVVPNPAVIDKMFLFYLLEWDVDKIKRDHGTGATMIHVSKKSMESRVLPYVSLDSQKEIVLRLQAMKNHTNSLKRQYDDKLRAIVAYKESILRKAFSGELVKE